MIQGRSFLIVPETFRAILEELEPGVHQFFPLTLEWKDGTPIERGAGRGRSPDGNVRYWFNPCNRIDGVDPVNTTWLRSAIWKSLNPNLAPGEEPKLVFSRALVGDRHAWIEKLIAHSLPLYISTAFGDRLRETNVTGLGMTYRDDAD